MNAKVLVTPPMLRTGDWPYRAVLERAGLEIVYPPPTLNLFDPAVLREAIRGAAAVLASVEPFQRPVIEKLGIKVIARVGVGYDAVEVPAATDEGIAVTITPGTNEHAVAEHAVAMMLAVWHGYPWRDAQTRGGQWNRALLPRLAGRTLGLVGLGRIGRAIVPRAQGLGLNVMAYDPFADRAFAERTGIEIVALEDLFRRADVVSLHAPATPETHDLVNDRTLAWMKKGSILINTARGGLVDEDAVARALASGHLAGAGLDVFKVEPLPMDSPLRQQPNVLFSPHVGGIDQEAIEAMSTLAAQCVADLYTGRWPAHCIVNPEVQAKWSWPR